MNSFNIIIFPVIFFFINTSPKLVETMDFNDSSTNEHKIYFIKQRWHTAIVLNTKELNPNLFIVYDSFNDFELIDIGWGDEEFYQIPGFDSGIAFKALFYKTPSTLRVEGIGISKAEYFDLSEIVIELSVTDNQFLKICKFINNTFELNDNNHPEILSEKSAGKIIFYKAKGYYHIFNTCNTWLAKCLNSSGLNIEDDIILTEQLFNELSKIGRVVKAD